MREQAEQNKKAWECRAYEFLEKNYGSPAEAAAKIKANPMARLHCNAKYFKNIEGYKIANVCGSSGRTAVPLALLGADVTVFDISEENKRYGLELAACAEAEICYELGDFCETDAARFAGDFDMAYAELGILHYFTDLDKFFDVIYSLLKGSGRLILTDFHPFRKVERAGTAALDVKQTDGDYFDSRMHEVDVAYQHAFDEEAQADFPKCRCRFYTIGEIINAAIRAGFTLKEFVEHPSWENEKLPALFTMVVEK